MSASVIFPRATNANVNTTVNVGDVSLNPTDTTPSVTVIDTTSGTISIPAGAKEIYLENVGGLTPENNSTVNGVNVEPDYVIDRREFFNGPNRVQLGAYTIVTNGNRWRGYYSV